jgi:hypothetical protein
MTNAYTLYLIERMYYNCSMKGRRMETYSLKGLENWVLDHAAAGHKKLYFTINGDVPLTDGGGQALYFEVPVRGKRVCVLHPEHLTTVARLCYESGIEMIQVII